MHSQSGLKPIPANVYAAHQKHLQKMKDVVVSITLLMFLTGIGLAATAFFTKNVTLGLITISIFVFSALVSILGIHGIEKMNIAYIQRPHEVSGKLKEILPAPWADRILVTFVNEHCSVFLGYDDVHVIVLKDYLLKGREVIIEEKWDLNERVFVATRYRLAHIV